MTIQMMVPTYITSNVEDGMYVTILARRATNHTVLNYG